MPREPDRELDYKSIEENIRKQMKKGDDEADNTPCEKHVIRETLIEINKPNLKLKRIIFAEKVMDKLIEGFVSEIENMPKIASQAARDAQSSSLQARISGRNFLMKFIDTARPHKNATLPPKPEKKAKESKAEPEPEEPTRSVYDEIAEEKQSNNDNDVSDDGLQD